LLGDTFSQVALKRTTAGVNFFRIIQPTEHEGEVSAEPTPEEEWSTIGDDKNIQEADVVHNQISKDNEELRSCDTVVEKTFDIRIGYPICKMRNDTQLVLIDIPGINEAESSQKYKDYVVTNWKTFDCVVVVMDAFQGVNTDEQVELLEFVRCNNRESKDIPTIVLGNKMDDLNDEDTILQIADTCLKTIEIFGDIECKSVQHVENTVETKRGTPDGGVIQTAFIPLSAKNAFIYMKAGSIGLGLLHDPKYLDLVNKIGSYEFGRKWSRMKLKDKIDAVFEILRDPSELEERLAGTNFNSFLITLSKFVGGNMNQQSIIAKQIEVELEGIRSRSLGEKAISESIFEAYKRSQSIERTDIDGLKNTFWEVYQDYENTAYKQLTENVRSVAMVRPFVELEKYHELASLLEWKEESLRAMDAIKKLLKGQLQFLIKKLGEWSLESYCVSTGGVKKDSSHSRCPHCRRYGDYCGRVFRKSESYCVCDNSSPDMEWKNGWKSPGLVEWGNLSPSEWIVILDSLLLVWNQSRFIEDFGPEMVKLNAALTSFNSIFGIFGTISCATMDPMDSICLYAYKDEIKKNKDFFAPRFKMPVSLADHSHWGFLAWNYLNFGNRNKGIIN
jgi:signal recognition particle receptor subunit beta